MWAKSFKTFFTLPEIPVTSQHFKQTAFPAAGGMWSYISMTHLAWNGFTTISFRLTSVLFKSLPSSNALLICSAFFFHDSFHLVIGSPLCIKRLEQVCPASTFSSKFFSFKTSLTNPFVCPWNPFDIHYQNFRMLNIEINSVLYSHMRW